MSQHVRAAFESRLNTWATTQVPPLTVSFESVSFSKPADGSPFLECFLKPTPTMNREVSGTRSTEYGLFMVNVWAQDGLGMGQAEGLADQIKALFPIFPKFGDVSVEQTPTVNTAIKDESGAWVITPVLIKYRYEVYPD